MTNRVRFASIALAAGAALALAACGDETAPEPAGEDTAAMMPDTEAPVTNADGTAPDAADTGVTETTTPDVDDPPA
ncbi:MAG: hypothetical protein V7678_00970 [Brevundimonas sp.]